VMVYLMLRLNFSIHAMTMIAAMTLKGWIRNPVHCRRSIGLLVDSAGAPTPFTSSNPATPLNPSDRADPVHTSGSLITHPMQAKIAKIPIGEIIRIVESVRSLIFGTNGVNDDVADGKNVLIVPYILILTIHEIITRNTGVKHRMYLKINPFESGFVTRRIESLPSACPLLVFSI
jgi:hypothetical protein